jgi:lysophospholipase L1-like esterase
MGMPMLDFVMRQWDSAVRSILPARATDKVQVRVEGLDSDRVLILGDGPTVGWGVDSQDDALLGCLARELSLLSGRGVTVDLVTDPLMTAERAATLVQDLLVWRYDYVFILLGTSDTTRLTSISTWRRAMSKLLTFVTAELAVSAHIVVASIAPFTGIKQVTWPFSTIIARRLEALNEVTEELCVGLPRLRYVEIVGPNPSAMKNSYALLATQLVGALARVLSDEAQIEGVREHQRIDTASPTDAAPEDTLGMVRELVRRAFQLENASVAVLEGNRQWRIDSSGTTLEETKGSSVFAESALHSNDVIIVRDTRKDRRFPREPLIVDAPTMRFYAGFPIETPLGVRVGNLCVTHPTRRIKGNDVDVVALRQLSKIALLDLWQYLPPQREPATSTAELRPGD